MASNFLGALLLVSALLSGWSITVEKNHLQQSSSLYLKRAMDQPVNWYPWSVEAFAEARCRNVPVLLDVGAIWCPWCNLMDQESYTQIAMAAFINKHFVAVKVDYDQDPRLSARLQRAQALANLPAGLPLTAFITPGGKLYFGGTYFAAKRQDNGLSFRDELEHAAYLYRDHRSEIEVQGVDLKLSEEFREKDSLTAGATCNSTLGR